MHILKNECDQLFLYCSKFIAKKKILNIYYINLYLYFFL